MVQFRNSLLLFLAATIWGVSFVAQSVGLQYIDPMTFCAIRTFLGGLVLLPFIWIIDKKESRRQKIFKWDKNVIIGGICCGAALFVGSYLQQWGIKLTTVGKTGFLTAFYVVLVPIIGLVVKRKSPWTIWIGMPVAIVGFYFLCITESLSINIGDIILLIGAIVFAIHILLIDHFVQKADGVRLSCAQFFACSAFATIGMFIFEEPKIEMMKMAWLPIAYSGILSCGVATTIQVIGQSKMNPSVASLILGLESVMGVLAGWVLLGESMNGREIFGCVLIFIAITIVECVPTKKKESAKELK